MSDTVKQTPVLLLTGYLGSGKSTLLNRLLQNNQNIRFAVMVNDIGEVNIDAELIQRGGLVSQQDDSLVALENGCICCTLKSDLIEQIENLLSMNCFDYVVIEASGVCEPGPIAQTLCTLPYANTLMPDKNVPYIDHIVTVVDALRIKDEFLGGEGMQAFDADDEGLCNLVIKQIEFCNTILLNKADMVTAQELDRIQKVIKALQPQAAIIPCNYCEVPFDKILHTHQFNFEQVATSATWINEIEHHHEHSHEHECEHEHDGECHCHEHDGECHCHHHHDHVKEEYGIETFVYYRRQPLDMVRFDEFVARQWPKSIIRSKGICYFRDEEDTCYVFEQAGKQVELRNAGQWYATMPPEELEEMMQQEKGLREDWDSQYGDRMQKIVFIGIHMDTKKIIQHLDDCLVDF